MSGRGAPPKKGAKRANRESQWRDAELEDEDWAKLLDSGEVPPVPDGVAWSDRAVRLWAAVWSGPVRGDLLPQHMPQLELVCDLCSASQLEDAFKDRKSAATEFRLVGQAFGLNPLDMARLRIDTKVVAPVKADPPAVKSKAERRARVRAVDAG